MWPCWCSVQQRRESTCRKQHLSVDSEHTCISPKKKNAGWPQFRAPWKREGGNVSMWDSILMRQEQITSDQSSPDHGNYYKLLLQLSIIKNVKGLNGKIHLGKVHVNNKELERRSRKAVCHIPRWISSIAMQSAHLLGPALPWTL